MNPYNWEEERLIYTAEDFSARSTMRTVIDAMERSMKDASPSVREQAADILITMRGVLEDEIESLTAQISSTSEAIVDANQSIRTAQNRVTSAPAGTDLAGLISQADQATAYAERLQTTLQEQQDKLEDYREAVSQVRFYQASLGHAGGGPVNLVSASLRNIQPKRKTLSKRKRSLPMNRAALLAGMKILRSMMKLRIRISNCCWIWITLFRNCGIIEPSNRHLLNLTPC